MRTGHVIKLFILLLAAMLASATVWAYDWEGNGTNESPYLIKTTADMNALASEVNNGTTYSSTYFQLANDLDYSGVTLIDGSNYTPVGANIGNGFQNFCGIFDGAGHTVKGITLSASVERQGLFGSVGTEGIVGTGGIVRNVTVTGSSFAGGNNVGGIAGYNQGGTVENCHVTSTVTIGTIAMNKHNHGQTGCEYFGGIVGINYGGTVAHCLAVGATVSAVTNSGAIVGSNTSTLSYNYYGHCTVGEATSKIGIHGNDVETNDGAVQAIILYDHGTEASSNGTAISSNIGDSKKVALYGRTLYKDGKWNTLCLPFGLTSLTGTPLEGATVKTLTSTGIADGILTFNFSDAPSIEAGKPYLVKWASGDNILNPVFSGVTISNTTANVSTTYVDFTGTYNLVSYADENKSVLFMGSGSKLYYPDGTSTITIGACRAYFQLKGITAGDPENGVKAFKLNFGEEDATRLNEELKMKNEEFATAPWYDLNGRKLAGKPTQKGIYIHNGSKVLK